MFLFPLSCKVPTANRSHSRLDSAVGRDADCKTARELVPNLEDFWFEIYGKVALTGETLNIYPQLLKN